jgi:transcriptional regulator with XRE-family HTH domain
MNGRELVAWNLRRIRVARGLSQEKLAVDADIDRTYVSRLERGLENPTVGVLDRLGAALSVAVSELLARPSAGERRPKPLKAGRRKKPQTQREQQSSRNNHTAPRRHDG